MSPVEDQRSVLAGTPAANARAVTATTNRANIMARIAYTGMRLLLPLLMIIASLATGCASGPSIDTSYTAVNQDSRVKFVVIHFTNESWESSLSTLTAGKAQVSSHYLVRDDPPVIYRLVDESKRAWHAGVSSWRRTTALNSASIGIEIVNMGDRSPPGTP